MRYSYQDAAEVWGGGLIGIVDWAQNPSGSGSASYRGKFKSGRNDITFGVPTASGTNTITGGSGRCQQNGNSFIPVTEPSVGDALGTANTGTWGFWWNQTARNSAYSNHAFALSELYYTGTQSWSYRFGCLSSNNSRMQSFITSNNAGSSPNVSESLSNTFSLNVWYYWMFVLEGSGLTRIYKNGVLDVSSYVKTQSSVGINNGTRNIMIGGMNNDVIFTPRAYIKHIAFSTKTCTASDANRIYQFERANFNL